MRQAPGAIRDAIIEYLEGVTGDASLSEIDEAVRNKLGPIGKTSVRTYCRNDKRGLFERTGRGRYRLAEGADAGQELSALRPAFEHEGARFFHANCYDWLTSCAEGSIEAVVTDPPYSPLEYAHENVTKLRGGRGGVWRIPPSFDGHARSPLPRFTTLKPDDLRRMRSDFTRLGRLISRILVPGGNVVVASNPLLSHIVASGLAEGGLEPRGYIARLVMTMRGGDRPKNAHEEFPEVSVMPRSQWEPWVVMRKPLEGRVQDNLRQYGTGGFRRPSDEQPFGDVIASTPTPRAERAIAPHPSLKPQEFLRQVVRASLPLGKGTVLDPFAGSGSTLAAANAVGYQSVGIELDPEFVALASHAIPTLGRVGTIQPTLPKLRDASGIERCRAGA